MVMRAGTFLGAFLLSVASTNAASAAVLDMLGDVDFSDPTVELDVATFEAARDEQDISDGPFNLIFGRDTGWEAYSADDAAAGADAYGWVWWYNPTHEKAQSGWVPQWTLIPDLASDPNWLAPNTGSNTTAYYKWTGPVGTAPHGATYAMGSDETYALKGSLGVIDYTHNYALAGNEKGALLELGLVDHDGEEPGDTIRIEIFDIIAGQFVTINDWSWNHPTVGRGSQSTVSVIIGKELLFGNVDTLQVRISATGSGACEQDMDATYQFGYENGHPTLDYVPSCHGNGIGVDYSRMSSVISTPLPAPAFMLIGALAGLGALRRRAKA